MEDFAYDLGGCNAIIKSSDLLSTQESKQFLKVSILKNNFMETAETCRNIHNAVISIRKSPSTHRNSSVLIQGCWHQT